MADGDKGQDIPSDDDEKKRLRDAAIRLMQQRQRNSPASGSSSESPPSPRREEFETETSLSVDPTQLRRSSVKDADIEIETDLDHEHLQQGRRHSLSRTAMPPEGLPPISCEVRTAMLAPEGLPPPSYEEMMGYDSDATPRSHGGRTAPRNRFRDTRDQPQDELEMEPFINANSNADSSKSTTDPADTYKLDESDRRRSIIAADSDGPEPHSAANGDPMDLGTEIHIEAREALERRSSVVSVEEGRGQSSANEDASISTRFWKFIRRSRAHMTPFRFMCLVVAIVGILALLVFVSIFPPSFVYLDYDKIALSYNTITGTVDRSTTYYYGCYVLGPSTRFLEFSATAHDVSHHFDVFTVDRLPIFVAYYLQYYIRPSELGTLHRKFGKDYDAVLQSIMKSEVKNSATPFSVNDFRLKRSEMEVFFHEKLQQRLGGTCCQSCCPSNCPNNTVCSTCLPAGSCEPAYHIDIRYFQLGQVSIPSDVSQLYLQRSLLQVYAEKEYFVQESMVTEKETERSIQQTQNEAAEKTAAGTADADLILKTAEAERQAELTLAYVQALSFVYNRLNVTNEEHKLSIMMIRAFEDQAVRGNLFRSYNYDNNTIFTRHGAL